MAQLPFPITAETLEDLRFQFSEIIREIYEENVGGLYLGDVFSDGGDYLTLDLDSTGGLEKDGGELQVKCKSDGGIGTSSAGTYVQCKAFGGLDTDSSGLYIKSAVVKGYREGLLVTIKDADELYVSSGAIEICGATYSASTTITVSLGTVSANTLYYLYVSAPATDTTLAAGQFSVSSTAPTWNDTYGAYYKTGDATKRLLAKYYINSIGVSKVIDERRVGIGMDSDNVLNDEELLAYDTLIGGFKGVEKSTDGTLADNSDNAIPTEKAVKTYADTMVTKATFNANTILKADSDDTPEALTVGEQTLVGRITDGEIAALSASQVRTLLDVPTNAEAVLDTLFNANTILKADSDDTPEALTVGEGTIVGRAAGGEITALDNVTRGHREGLRVTIKDADELYVSGGTIEINGTVYESEAQLAVTLSGIVEKTLYYIYVSAPASGLTLTATEFTVSTTAPAFDNARGAYYMTGDSTKRLLAKFTQGIGTLVQPIDDDDDDGGWMTSGKMYTENTSYFGNVVITGTGRHLNSFFKFNNIPITHGGTVSSAIVTFVSYIYKYDDTVNANCYFVAADNVTSVPASAAEAEALSLGTPVAWNAVAHWETGLSYNTPELSPALQEVVDRPGWARNNSIMLVIKDNGSSNDAYRSIKNYPSGYPAILTLVVDDAICDDVSRVIDSHHVEIGIDSGNVESDGDILIYDAFLKGYRTVPATEMLGVSYFKERPRIELSRVLGVSKPSIVFRGTIRGFSLPVYSSDNEELFLDLPNVPARWDGASDPIVYITGYLDTANTSKKFKLCCDWTYFSAGDEPDGVAVESPSVETTTATWGQYHTFTAAITLDYDVVAANALAVGDFLQLRVYRIAASGDEIAGEVVVTGVAIKWRMDKLYSSS